MAVSKEARVSVLILSAFIAFAYNRYLLPLCQVKEKRTSQEDTEEKKALVQVQYRKQQGRKLEEKTSPEKRRGDESLRDSEMY